MNSNETSATSLLSSTRLPPTAAIIMENDLSIEEMFLLMEQMEDEHQTRKAQMFERVLNSLSTADKVEFEADSEYHIVKGRMEEARREREQEKKGHEKRKQERIEMAELEKQREALRRRFDADSEDSMGLEYSTIMRATRIQPTAEDRFLDSIPTIPGFNMEDLLACSEFDTLLEEVESSLHDDAYEPSKELAEVFALLDSAPPPPPRVATAKQAKEASKHAPDHIDRRGGQGQPHISKEDLREAMPVSVKNSGVLKREDNDAIPSSSTSISTGALNNHSGESDGVTVETKPSTSLLEIFEPLLMRMLAHSPLVESLFGSPVDYHALGLFDYPLIIHHPMDFGTILSRLRQQNVNDNGIDNRKNSSSSSHNGDEGFYHEQSDVMHDIRLCFDNAMTYNPVGSDVHSLAKDLKNWFDGQCASLIIKEITLKQQGHHRQIQIQKQNQKQPEITAVAEPKSASQLKPSGLPQQPQQIGKSSINPEASSTPSRPAISSVFSPSRPPSAVASSTNNAAISYNNNSNVSVGSVEKNKQSSLSKRIQRRDAVNNRDSDEDGDDDDDDDSMWSANRQKMKSSAERSKLVSKAASSAPLGTTATTATTASTTTTTAIMSPSHGRIQQLPIVVSDEESSDESSKNLIEKFLEVSIGDNKNNNVATLNTPATVVSSSTNTTEVAPPAPPASLTGSLLSSSVPRKPKRER